MANVTITHQKVSSGTVNPAVEVDLHDWNNTHTVTGLENVDNTSDADKPVSTAVAAAIRERLTGNRTYYYRADGSDSNAGSALDAFLTAQKAYDTICDKIDLNGFNVTIACGSASGTVFTSGITTSKSPIGNSGGACVTWDGNGSTVRVTNGACLETGSANGFGGYPQILFQNIRFETITSGNCINARGGVLLGGTGLVFGACAGIHVFFGHMGHIGLGNYTIAGSAVLSHIYGYGQGFMWTEGATTTISAAVTFGTYITLIQGATALMGGQTFVNPSNVTGSKFLIEGSGSNIDAAGENLSYLPGTIAGIVQSGGSYNHITDTTGWTPFTPTITPTGGGAYTCSMRYKLVGGIVHYTGLLTSVTVGTGLVSLSLPVVQSPTSAYMGTAFSPDTPSVLIVAAINLYNAALALAASNAVPTAANGQHVYFSGAYEAA